MKKYDKEAVAMKNQIEEMEAVMKAFFAHSSDQDFWAILKSAKDDAAAWRRTGQYAQASLEAAGVPALMAELQQRELTEKIIRKLKAEYDKQANYPHEEGETWSYASMSKYKAQLDLLFEMGHLAHDPDIISRLLYEDSQFLDRWLDSAEAKHHDAYSFLQSLGVVATTDRSRGDEGVACGTHRRA